MPDHDLGCPVSLGGLDQSGDGVLVADLGLDVELEQEIGAIEQQLVDQRASERASPAPARRGGRAERGGGASRARSRASRRAAAARRPRPPRHGSSRCGHSRVSPSTCVQRRSPSAARGERVDRRGAQLAGALVESIQIWRQVPGGDLARGRPCGCVAYLGAEPGPAADAGGQVEGLAARQQLPLITGWKGSGVMCAPAKAAIDSAAASACWQPMPPCLMANSIASPAAKMAVDVEELAVGVDAQEAVFAERHASNSTVRRARAGPRSGRR